MPRNDASHLYMAAQVQGRTLERQADGLRQTLCRLSAGQGGSDQTLKGVDTICLQLDLAERLILELSNQYPEDNTA